jgi:F0F1-type ATP synthase membrane subunit b/b'
LLSLNSALFIHLILFVVVVLLCSPLLIKPTMALLEEREQRIRGARSRARSLQEESEARLHEIEQRLTQERNAAVIEREKMRAEFVKKADSLVAGARQNAMDKIAAMRQRITAEREDARRVLIAEATALSRQIAEQVLGRKVA